MKIKSSLVVFQKDKTVDVIRNYHALKSDDRHVHSSYWAHTN